MGNLISNLERIYPNLLRHEMLEDYYPVGYFSINSTLTNYSGAIIKWPDKEKEKLEFLCTNNFKKDKFQIGVDDLLEKENCILASAEYTGAFFLWPAKLTGILYRKINN